MNLKIFIAIFLVSIQATFIYAPNDSLQECRWCIDRLSAERKMRNKKRAFDELEQNMISDLEKSDNLRRKMAAIYSSNKSLYRQIDELSLQKEEEGLKRTSLRRELNSKKELYWSSSATSIRPEFQGQARTQIIYKVRDLYQALLQACSDQAGFVFFQNIKNFFDNLTAQEKDFLQINPDNQNQDSSEIYAELISLPLQQALKIYYLLNFYVASPYQNQEGVIEKKMNELFVILYDLVVKNDFSVDQINLRIQSKGCCCQKSETSFSWLACGHWAHTSCKDSPCQYEECQNCCSICLCDFSEIKTDCGHYFHRKCLDSWLDQSASCPICRKFTEGVESLDPI